MFTDITSSTTRSSRSPGIPNQEVEACLFNDSEELVTSWPIEQCRKKLSLNNKDDGHAY
jgi:hypothetical protein